MGIITRGFTNGTIITRGFGSEFIKVLYHKVIHLKSYICRVLVFDGKINK